jgi:hypothetical protein
MTTEDWAEILATTIRHAAEHIGACKSDHPTVMLDELEEHSAVGYYDLRRLCLENPADLAEAGLVYDDQHRLLHRADSPPIRWGEPKPSE